MIQVALMYHKTSQILSLPSGRRRQVNHQRSHYEEDYFLRKFKKIAPVGT
jgi:hypothetical protein